MTATVNIHAAAEQIADEVFGEKARPTPEEIDELAREYEAAKLHVADERENLARVEERAVILVQTWGVVPAHAEKSRRLVGKLSELLVTRADTLTVVDDRVETL